MYVTIAVKLVTQNHSPGPVYWEHYCKRSVWVTAHWVSNTKACTKSGLWLLLCSSWAAGSLCVGHSSALQRTLPGEIPTGQRWNKDLLECSSLAIKLQGLKSNTEVQVYFKSEWAPERAGRGQDLGPCFCHPPGCPGLARKTDRQSFPPCWPAPVLNWGSRSGGAQSGHLTALQVFHI